MKAHEVADDHECSQCIMCLCSDTTSAISGKKGGALVEFDRIDGKARLHLLCRHHAAELQLKRAYKVAFGTTKSPANADFKKFRQTFPTLDLTAIQPQLNEKFHEPLMKRLLGMMKVKCHEALFRKSTKSECAVWLRTSNYFSH